MIIIFKKKNLIKKIKLLNDKTKKKHKTYYFNKLLFYEHD
jgi:hypothetical protein